MSDTEIEKRSEGSDGLKGSENLELDEKLLKCVNNNCDVPTLTSEDTSSYS